MILVDWTKWRPATCMPDACFCESIRDGLVRQPANTWSCAAIVLAGAIVLRRSLVRSDPNDPDPKPVHGVLYAAALILIGLGSAFYHASLTFAGQFADVLGMYLLGTFILLHDLSRLRPISQPAFAALYVVLNLILATGLYAVPQLRRHAFAALLISAVWLELRVRRRRRRRRSAAESGFLWIALLAITLGFAAWILDITRALCAPGGIVQGHAVWHVAGAVSAWCLYRYHRSEMLGGDGEIRVRI